jgi:hypothetical protein
VDLVEPLRGLASGSTDCSVTLGRGLHDGGHSWAGRLQFLATGVGLAKETADGPEFTDR